MLLLRMTLDHPATCKSEAVHQAQGNRKQGAFVCCLSQRNCNPRCSFHVDHRYAALRAVRTSHAASHWSRALNCYPLNYSNLKDAYHVNTATVHP